MSKRSKKRIKKAFKKDSLISHSNKSMSGDAYAICKAFLDNDLLNNKDFGADKCFALALISREEADHVLTRQAVFNLLNFINDEIPVFIKDFIKYKEKLLFTEKTMFIKEMNFDVNVHPYFLIIKEFIQSSKKQQIESYFNCFMGKAAKYSKDLPQLDLTSLSIEIVNQFYEIIHRVLLDKTVNEIKLKELTYFIFNKVKGEASQTLLFFMSYFDSDKEKKIQYANLFLDAKNYAKDNTSYRYALANNTAYAAADIGEFDEAEYWLEQVEDLEKHEKIASYLASKKAKSEEKHTHPLNPKNINPVKIDEILTKDLMYLCSFLDSCGEDWGLRPLIKYGRYVFASYETTVNIYISLALKGIIKLSPSSFATYDVSELENFSEIVENEKFHINVIGVIDNKSLALSILLEEINKREDKDHNLFEFWKEVSLSYFYSTLNYGLKNIRDSWAVNFVLNEQTILNLSNANLSAKVLSYIAKSALRYTAGQHAMGETQGNRHTCNILISSINNHLEWIEVGNFIDKSYPRNKQPVLSSEKIIEKIAMINPDDLYNLSPEYNLIISNHHVNDDVGF